MFHVVGNMTESIFGSKGKKIKGKVVLMRKNVLDFNNFASSAIDNISEFLGQGVSFQLVSCHKTDPGNGVGKVGKPAYLERWLTTLPSLTAGGKNEFAVHFDWDEEIAVPGVILVKNNHLSEFFLLSITLEDIPNQDDLHFVCNSWVYPSSKYKSDRIFFANKFREAVTPARDEMVSLPPTTSHKS